MRRDFSSVLRAHGYDLQAAVTASETASDYSPLERARDFAGAARWNLQAMLSRH
ncbi:unannotated protein [freshwater metagenome]